MAQAAPADDTVAPVVDSVTSTDFLPSGSVQTHHAAEPGLFTIVAHDDGSGLANVQWQLDTQFGVGGPPPRSRTSGSQDLQGVASATVTVSVTPPSWGSHQLYVRVVDLSGNVSWTVAYDFYALTNPTPQVRGDLTGDGVPDLLVTDGNGALKLLPGLGAGRFGHAITVSRSSRDTAWRTMPYVRMTTGISDVDALLSHPAGWDALELWNNDGIGDFSGSGVTVVQHPSCAAAACPTDFPTTFAGLTSFVSTGTGTGTTELVTIESGKAYIYPVGIRIGDGAPLPLAGVDLAHSDLVSPGDVDGDGVADLWVRNRLTGVVTQFAGTGSGFSSTGKVVARGLTAARWPVLVSVGDLTGSGVREVVLGAPGKPLQVRPVTDLAEVTYVLAATRLSDVVAVEGEPLSP